MTPFPAPNRLHVWWARRPLVASRAAILASILPATADRATFTHMPGILGDPIASRRRIDLAKCTGVRFEGGATDDGRAFRLSIPYTSGTSVALRANGAPHRHASRSDCGRRQHRV